MSTPSIIGRTTSTSAVGQVATLERPRIRALVISAAQNYAYEVNGIEQLTTSKSDSGEAGTFSFSFPLGGPSPTYVSDAAAADNAMPMDMVVIFGDRVTTHDAQPGWLGSSASSLTWGSPGAIITNQFAALSSCLFIGMIDTVSSDTDFTSASGTCTISGRDLTKILIDNDTFSPLTDPSGNLGLVNLYNVLIRRSGSGQSFLVSILEVFCKKDPGVIASLAASGAAEAPPGFQQALATLNAAQYGFPWDNFISTRLLTNPGFLNFPAGKFLPNFSVQEGSVWANLDDLRNYPLARLFVNETGALVFDDTYSAWGFGDFPQPVVAAVTPDDIRHQHFAITDDSLITALTVFPTLVAIGETATASQGAMGEPWTVPLVGTFGYRYAKFYSQWDAPDTGALARTALQARMGVLITLHNEMNRATITVKGNARYRVGTRIVCKYANASGHTLWGPRHTFQKPTSASGFLKAHVWYVTSVSHQYTWGNDWTTTLELRFPFDVDAALSPITTEDLIATQAFGSA